MNLFRDIKRTFNIFDFQKLNPNVTIVIGFLSIVFLTAGINKDYIFSGADEGWYDAARNEALSVGSNYSSGWAEKISITNGDTAKRAIADSLAANHLLRNVSFKTDQEVTITFYGTDINATDDSDSVSEVYPIGSFNWQYTNVDSIVVSNDSGDTVAFNYFVRAFKTKASL